MAEINSSAVWNYSATTTSTSEANPPAAGGPSGTPLSVGVGVGVGLETVVSSRTLIQAPPLPSLPQQHQQQEFASSSHFWNQSSPSYNRQVSMQYPGHPHHPFESNDRAQGGGPPPPNPAFYPPPPMLTSSLAHVIDTGSLVVPSVGIHNDANWPRVESPAEETSRATADNGTTTMNNGAEPYRMYPPNQQQQQQQQQLAPTTTSMTVHVSHHHQPWLRDGVSPFPMPVPPPHSHHPQRLLQPHGDFVSQSIDNGNGYHHHTRYIFTPTMSESPPEHSASWREAPRRGEGGGGGGGGGEESHHYQGASIPHNSRFNGSPIRPTSIFTSAQSVPDSPREARLAPQRSLISSTSASFPTRGYSLQHDTLSGSRSSGLVARPALGVRRRGTTGGASSSGGVAGLMSGGKRKPLPKIYGCTYDSCGKKFDRPSTLKVHEAIHTGAKDPSPSTSSLQRQQLLASSTTATTSSSSGSSSSSSGSSTSSFAPPRILPAPGSRAMVLRPPMMSAAATAHLVNSIGPANSLPHEGESSLQLGADGGGGPPTEVVRGAKAPMVIAAMFSMQQNVPQSIAKLTLVQVECESPLPPVRPHPKYTILYSQRDAFVTESSTATTATGGYNAYISPGIPPVVPGQTSHDAPIPGRNATIHAGLSVVVSGEELEEGKEREDEKGEEEEEVEKKIEEGEGGDGDGEESTRAPLDRSMRTQGLLPVPTDLFEERDSYYPRSRYCYHPAEWDSIMILPGPGPVPLPVDDGLEVEAMA
ncbi:hypothetical protein FRC17_009056 [Serendipita sp. 399]|nr:hypothetical protein FRC17_009056 [Serendipita sp. 399]